MNCPICGSRVQLTTPDYGYGYGAEFVCYGCNPYGRRFAVHGAEAKRESDESLGASRANAEADRDSREGK